MPELLTRDFHTLADAALYLRLCGLAHDPARNTWHAPGLQARLIQVWRDHRNVRAIIRRA